MDQEKCTLNRGFPFWEAGKIFVLRTGFKSKFSIRDDNAYHLINRKNWSYWYVSGCKKISNGFKAPR